MKIEKQWHILDLPDVSHDLMCEQLQNDGNEHDIHKTDHSRQRTVSSPDGVFFDSFR